GRREVDEVQRVADDAADAGLRAPLPEALEGLRLVVRGPPHARALREHLHGVAADRLDPVDRRVDAACAGDVRADLHAATLPVRGRLAGDHTARGSIVAAVACRG